MRRLPMEVELNKKFACQLTLMLESRLIWYKHFQLFCDEIIEEYAQPPYWIIELAAVRYQGSAIEIVNTYIQSDPFFDRNESEFFDQYIACLYLKYDRREKSWASFLWSAGEYADSCEAVKEPCEYFYHLLNEYERSEFDPELEDKQNKEIQSKFRKEIKEMQALYEMFKRYFRQYVRKENNEADDKWVTCTSIGGYGQALTRGKVYPAVAEETDRFRIIGDHHKKVWINKHHFAEGRVEVPVLTGWQFDDPIEDFRLVEVTVTFHNGMKRWGLLATPERLAEYFQQTQLDPPGFHLPYLIVVRTMSNEDVERTLRHLDEQGELEQATLWLC